MEQLSELNLPLVVLIPVLGVVYFLPTIIALVLNRQHKKQIMLANLPAGLVWTLWVGVLVWAVTGKKQENQDSERSSSAES